MKWLYNYADHVVCVSHYMKNHLVKDFGVDSSKASVIYNPVVFYGSAGESDKMTNPLANGGAVLTS